MRKHRQFEISHAVLIFVRPLNSGMYFSIEASTFACLQLATNFETCFFFVVGDYDEKNDNGDNGDDDDNNDDDDGTSPGCPFWAQKINFCH